MNDSSWAQTKHRLGLWTAAILRDVFGETASDRFGILMYHRFSEIPNTGSPPTWSVTPPRFREQLQGLLSRGFKAIPLDQAIELAANDKPFPKKAFVVTIDDGYENVYTHAWPILRELKVPATLFLPTEFLGARDPFPFDDWQDKGNEHITPESWRPMTIDQCRELQREGTITLGAHTHSHLDFRGKPSEFAADLAKNLYYLRDVFGIEQPTFAFPYGTKSAGFAGGALTEAVRSSGATCALTTEAVTNSPRRDVFDWGRFEAEGQDTAATLAGKLSGWFNSLQRVTRAVAASATSPAQS
jgi:peptidoglycan/xylan/chitin deacetylase (PgdA/CDA1 family)